MSLYKKYSQFVDHPRYGQLPRFSGVKASRVPIGCRQMGYHSQPAVEGTAVLADLDRQSFSPIPVAYYFDAERVCADCKRPFLFFAEEQKYWYEELGFPLASDCVRCVPCRKRQQAIAKARARYEQLVTNADRTLDETAELGECCLKLVEENIFPPRRLETVRMVLNRLRKSDVDLLSKRCAAITSRLLALEGRRSE